MIEAVLAGGPHRPAPDELPNPEPRQAVIAVELSSFQLYWAPSIRPAAGVVLNVAEDHLDWHGSMAAYAAAKARALTGRVALAVIDDPGAADLLAAAPARLAVPIMSGRPFPGALGVRHGVLVDTAFGQDELIASDQVRPAGEHNLTNALAAAGLALAVGVRAGAVAPGCRTSPRAGTAMCWSPSVPGCGTSTIRRPRTRTPRWPRCRPTRGWCGSPAASSRARRWTIWCAGSVIGWPAWCCSASTRRSSQAALSRHAPDVPVLLVPGKDDDVMRTVVSAAASMAAPGDVVLLAPAAASLDMYSSYAARGNAFAAAAAALPDSQPGKLMSETCGANRSHRSDGIREERARAVTSTIAPAATDAAHRIDGEDGIRHRPAGPDRPRRAVRRRRMPRTGWTGR